MAEEMDRLIHDVGEIPRDLRKRLRPKVRAAGNIVARDARLRASWSTRIPAAIRVRTAFAKSPGVRVSVDLRKAPHAKPYENEGRPGKFRHPVFGNRSNWVTQKARPFLGPALQAKSDAAAHDIADAVDRATRDAGFR